MVIGSARSKVTTVTGRDGGGEGEGAIAGTVVVVGEGEGAISGTIVLVLVGKGEGTTAGTIVLVGEGEVAFPISSG